MLIAWTTVATRADADALAHGIIAENLAVCVQVDGPIVSHYAWEGKIEQSEEFRLTLKLLDQQLLSLESHVLRHHPYRTPQWIVVSAQHVGEKYLSWATANVHSRPF